MKISKTLPLLLSLILLLTCSCSFAQEPKEASPVSIIPKPQHLTPKQGQFILNTDTKIYVPAENAELRSIADKLAASIKTATGVQPQVLTKKAPTKVNNSIQASPYCYSRYAGPRRVCLRSSIRQHHTFG
ncbi:glycoside hydrolase family 20 zincin-like fold domain-containing protein [Pontibacter rugosus]